MRECKVNGVMYKRLYFIGIGAYAIMLFFSILFYKERIIFLDTAFTLFHIIKDNHFYIGFYRFGDAFNQIPPFLAIKSGLSLKIAMIAYSAGFVVYYFICYFICGCLKRYDFALIVLLLNMLLFFIKSITSSIELEVNRTNWIKSSLS